MMITKQLKVECMCHRQLIHRLENEHKYQQLTINKLNVIFIRQVNYLPNISCEELMRKLIE